MKVKEITQALIEGLVRSRRQLYQSGFIDQVKLDVPVWSVGNLTFGGSGKTPVVQMLAREQIQAGRRVVVIAKSYKTRLREPREVLTLNPDSQPNEVGDEAYLHKVNLPNAFVWSGPNKWQTAVQAMSSVQADLVIVDDGFQHLPLYRDRDILCLDVSRPIQDYQIFPFGSCREGLSSMSFATEIFLTKMNLSTDLTIEEWKIQLKGFKKTGFEFQIQVEGLPTDHNEGVVVVSGLARNQSFSDQIKGLGYPVLDALAFSDHHHYSAKDQELMMSTLHRTGAKALITTEKDFIKLRGWPLPLHVAKLKLNHRDLSQWP